MSKRHLDSKFVRYNRLFTTFLLLFFLFLSARICYVDPYWVTRRSPPWYIRYHGHNRVLDIRSRFAKSLQLLSRQPLVIVLGSSRVYRGIPIGEIYGEDGYNLGLSSLRLREALDYIVYAVNYTKVQQIFFGIDWFMFDHDRQWEKGFDPEMHKPSYIIRLFFSSLLSRMAIDDCRLALAGKHTGDGYWRWSGFKVTNPRNDKALERILNSFYKKKKIITDDEYACFSKMIRFCQKKNIQLHLYISPLNSKMIKRMRSQRVYEDFCIWKNRLFLIGKRMNIPVYDFSENNPFFLDDLTHGSTKNWIDTSHYSPHTGKWIIQTITGSS